MTRKVGRPSGHPTRVADIQKLLDDGIPRSITEITEATGHGKTQVYQTLQTMISNRQLTAGPSTPGRPRYYEILR